MLEASELLAGVVSEEVLRCRHDAVEIEVVKPRSESVDLARDVHLVHCGLPLATRTIELAASFTTRHEGPSSLDAAPSIWTASRYPCNVPTSTYERPMLTARALPPCASQAFTS